MFKRKTQNNRAGFSLIETIVAFAIISIILVVALIGFNTIANVGNRAQEWNQADQSVEDLIAQGADYTDSPALSITLTPPGGEEDPIDITGVLRTFTDPDSGKTITIFVKKTDG